MGRPRTKLTINDKELTLAVSLASTIFDCSETEFLKEGVNARLAQQFAAYPKLAAIFGDFYGPLPAWLTLESEDPRVPILHSF